MTLVTPECFAGLSAEEREAQMFLAITTASGYTGLDPDCFPGLSPAEKRFYTYAAVFEVSVTAGLVDPACFLGLSREEQDQQMFAAVAGIEVAPPIVAPLLVSATVESNGTTLTLVFDQAVEFGAGGNTGWTIAPSGGAATLVYGSGAGTMTLTYTISRTIGPAETATLDYVQPGDGVENATGIDLANISGSAVTNNAVFSPTTIAGLKLWLKADALALADADPVTTWTDSSGLGNSAAQATVAQKPTYKTGIVNGKPVVRFDGVDDFMVCPAITAAAGLSAFVVWKMIAATSFGMTLVLTDGSSELRQNGANLQMLCGANPISGGVADTAWHVHSFTNNGSNLSELWTDGVSNGTSVTSVACGTPSIGARNAGSFPFNGDVAEILLYDSSLSAGNRQAVEAYLKAKYATP